MKVNHCFLFGVFPGSAVVSFSAFFFAALSRIPKLNSRRRSSTSSAMPKISHRVAIFFGAMKPSAAAQDVMTSVGTNVVSLPRSVSLSELSAAANVEPTTAVLVSYWRTFRVAELIDIGPPIVETSTYDRRVWWRNDSLDGEDVNTALNALENASADDQFEGHGAAFWNGKLVPLVLVHAARDPRPQAWSGRSRGALALFDLPGIFVWLYVRFSASLPMPPWAREAPAASRPEFATRGAKRPALLRVIATIVAARREARRRKRDIIAIGLAIPAALADFATRSTLETLEYRTSWLVAYLPESRFSAGGWRVRGDRNDEFASPGFWITGADDTALVTTAGHLHVEPGEVVHWERSSRFRSLSGALGTMKWRTTPRDPPQAPPFMGVDLALIVPSAELHWEKNSVLPVHARGVDEENDFEWNGGASGRQLGWVAGPLRRRKIDGKYCKRCWLLVGKGRPGDSGSPVTRNDPSGELLGHVVGVKGRLDRSGARDATIVQDIHSLLDAVSTMYPAPFDVGLTRSQI